MATRPTTTAEYLAALSSEQRRTVQRMLKAIHAGVPEADAAFSYRMPGFTLHGRPLLWAAAWKAHYSVYPVTAERAASVALPGEEYEVEKSTIRFAANKEVPYDFVARLAKAIAKTRT